MTHDLICWKCGASLAYAILPLSRRETCKSCNAEQHVCRLCKHFDSRVSDQCTEERAEQVSNKELANFCDYFDPQSGAWQGDSSSAQKKAADDLAALFGEGPADQTGDSAVSDELNKLFGLDKN
jgi:hypothetical protein